MQSPSSVVQGLGSTKLFYQCIQRQTALLNINQIITATDNSLGAAGPLGGDPVISIPGAYSRFKNCIINIFASAVIQFQYPAGVGFVAYKANIVRIGSYGANTILIDGVPQVLNFTQPTYSYGINKTPSTIDFSNMNCAVSVIESTSGYNYNGTTYTILPGSVHKVLMTFDIMLALSDGTD